ncbi:hypothetical protein V6N13_080484 [Hibiscus sabdariffa]
MWRYSGSPFIAFSELQLTVYFVSSYVVVIFMVPSCLFIPSEFSCLGGQLQRIANLPPVWLIIWLSACHADCEKPMAFMAILCDKLRALDIFLPARERKVGMTTAYLDGVRNCCSPYCSDSSFLLHRPWRISGR